MKNYLLVFIITAFVISGINAQINSPILIRPPNNSTGISVTPILQWSNNTNATVFEIWISTDSSFNFLVTPQIPDPTLSYYEVNAGSLNLNTSYFWKARVINPYSSFFSDTWSFTTVVTLQQDILLIIDDVNALVNNGVLLVNQGNILNNRLNQAINKLDHGDTANAINRLQSFEDRVIMLQNSQVLSLDEAHNFLNCADGVLSIINSNQQNHFILPNNNNNIAHNFKLTQNYPNPFNPTTSIEYSIPERSYVTLKIFDMLGKEVATLVSKEQEAGPYISIWNATRFSSGLYFYRLTSGKNTETKKMTLNK